MPQLNHAGPIVQVQLEVVLVNRNHDVDEVVRNVQ